MYSSVVEILIFTIERERGREYTTVQQQFPLVENDLGPRTFFTAEF